MAVIRENEIQLNGIRYPLTGKVKPVLSAGFAPKQVIGEYTKASNPEIDSWVISDQRGGILAEEMDETHQADRAWWSTCNLGFLGHILLPPLATAVTPATLDTPPAIVNADFELDDNWTNGSQSSTKEYEGTYSWRSEDTTGETIRQDLAWLDTYQGKTFHFYIWGYAEEANKLRPYLHDGKTPSYGEYHSGNSTWELLTVSKTFAADADTFTIGVDANSSTGHKYIDYCCFATTADATANAFCNYNSELYMAYDKSLYKLNDEGDGWTLVAAFMDTITALTAGEGNHLYIFFGNTPYYVYMDADQVFYNTNVANANLCIAWDSKLFKVDTAGSMSYSADPSAAIPSWTDDGDLADEGLADNDVQSLFIYRDAAGNPIIYAGTKKGLYAHSFGNDKWVLTELVMPDHPTAGKATVTWRDKSFISAGLDVIAYQTGQAGTAIASVGLDRDDGLPELRGGEVVKFIKGYNEFFALIDSIYEGATSRSTVMAYDGKGWQCWWEATADNTAMHSGIVSSDTAHRLWFGAGAAIYYIPLQRNLRNPKKVSTFAFSTAGVHITPWFDANWVGQKLALQLKMFCKDTTTDQTVLVEYRIDHATTGIATAWTPLGTIAAAGDGVETTYTFGSSLGINFKAIQFKFTLSRITTGDNPEYFSPDVQYAVLEYQKIIKPTWNWAFTIDCTKSYDKRSPTQMLDAVVTAAELETLTPFLYKDMTYYVRVKSVEGERLTGSGCKGTYSVVVSKPI